MGIATRMIEPPQMQALKNSAGYGDSQKQAAEMNRLPALTGRQRGLNESGKKQSNSGRNESKRVKCSGLVMTPYIKDARTGEISLG